MVLILLGFLLAQGNAVITFKDCVRNGEKYETIEKWIESTGHHPAKIMKRRSETRARSLEIAITQGTLNAYEDFKLFEFDPLFSDKYTPEYKEKFLKNAIDRINILTPPSPAHYSYSCFIHDEKWYILFTTTAALKSANTNLVLKRSLHKRIMHYEALFNYCVSKLESGINLDSSDRGNIYMMDNDLTKIVVVSDYLLEIDANSPRYREKMVAQRLLEYISNLESGRDRLVYIKPADAPNENDNFSNFMHSMSMVSISHKIPYTLDLVRQLIEQLREVLGTPQNSRTVRMQKAIAGMSKSARKQNAETMARYYLQRNRSRSRSSSISE